jgi:endonuclease YncB( thermonuclease family)
MSSLLIALGFLGLLLALVGLVKGSLRSVGLMSRRQCATAAVFAFVVMAVGGALAPVPPDAAGGGAKDRALPADAPAAPAPAASSRRTQPPPAVAAPTPPPATRATRAAAPRADPARTQRPVAPLLVMASGGDGDSWHDTSGVEYRLGLVNTPESGECGGPEGTAYRKRALAGGFRAQVYETDRYGRKVAVVLAPNGVNLNVAMARDGIANDRYLEQFRHENPSLAAQLDVAFREARAARRGIWGTCAGGGEAAEEPAPAQAPQPIAGGRCHPDYETCIPVQGDGSGRGAANDLDCGDVDGPIRLREVGRDPYRLDGTDRDGIGCE